MLRNLRKVVCWKHTAARRAAPRDHPLLSFSLFLLLLLALERKVWGSWQLTCVWLLYLSNLLVFLKKSLHIFKPQSLTNATFEAKRPILWLQFLCPPEDGEQAEVYPQVTPAQNDFPFRSEFHSLYEWATLRRTAGTVSGRIGIIFYREGISLETCAACD